MRKYLTIDRVSRINALLGQRVCLHGESRTVVDLLQCDDRVCRQALLRVLVKQEGLWCNGALLRRRHGRVLVVGIHDGGVLQMSRPEAAGVARCLMSS